MIRNDLKDFPFFDLKNGYKIRWHQPGDKQLWLNIQQKADKHNTITASVFDKAFQNSLQLLKDRQCFVFDQKENVVGTATAWFNNNYNGMHYGRVHWVAILPEKQRLGLAKSLMTVICQRLKKLGHDNAYLTTLSLRIPAINLYLKFGFQPEMRSPEDFQIWKRIQSKLKKEL